ncbi:MAG: hypothetical protein OQJ89_00920 [Kangiellaceae bacterium]|nr:hypothetical protein [Kangiellaceae bacterium]MCW8998744.1 hypothetical protein [Kangiellaceae bacterium]MCW9015503.1 hypothetical protein [Kangiellaceae bacterium]
MDFFEAIFTMVAVFICFVIWLLPILLIAVSSRTHGKEKAAWILAVIFISWFAWVFYLLLAPLRPRDEHRSYRHYRNYRHYR